MPMTLVFPPFCLLPVLSCSLSVLLSKSTGQGSQELIHNHVDLRGEVVGELHGKDHKDAVGEKLQGQDGIFDNPAKKNQHI